MILASRSSRLLSQMLDSAIALSPVVSLAILTAPSPAAPGGAGSMLWVPALVLCLGYLFFADALPGGQSVGKRVLGIAVVDERNGYPCSLWQSFVRNVLLAVFGVIDWVLIFGDQRQRMGDLAAGTIVVDAAAVRTRIRYQGYEIP